MAPPTAVGDRLAACGSPAVLPAAAPRSFARGARQQERAQPADELRARPGAQHRLPLRQDLGPLLVLGGLRAALRAERAAPPPLPATQRAVAGCARGPVMRRPTVAGAHRAADAAVLAGAGLGPRQRRRTHPAVRRPRPVGRMPPRQAHAGAAAEPCPGPHLLLREGLVAARANARHRFFAAFPAGAFLEGFSAATFALAAALASAFTAARAAFSSATPSMPKNLATS